MKKKLLVIIMATTLVLSGCGAKKSVENAEVVVGTEISATTESATVAEADTTEKASEENKSEEKESADATKDAASVAESKDDKSSTDASTKDEATKASSKVDEKNQTSKADAAASESTAAPAEQTAPAPAPEPAPEPEPAPAAPQTVDYGRIVYTGDSRSVDMFDGGVGEIWYGSYNGITVFCKDACQQDYMINAVNNVGWENFDTLVSWMGCNNYGDFGPYAEFYNYVLSQGKNLILCTVGPTLDSALANDFDRTHYTNDLQIAYNNSLWAWANANGVKVIDLYSYINSNPDIYLDPADGIHYQPQPTTVIWNVILSGLN